MGIESIVVSILATAFLVGLAIYATGPSHKKSSGKGNHDSVHHA